MASVEILSTPLTKLELYVLKVDSNGNIITFTSIPITQQIVTAYPNPFSEVLQIEISDELLGQELYLELIDLDGRIILQQSIDNLNIALNASRISTGTYVVVIKNEKGKLLWREKVVKS